MRLLSFEIILSWISWVVAESCTGEQKLNLEDFQFVEHSNENLDGLSEKLKSREVSLTKVIEDGNHKLTKASPWEYSAVKDAIQWESKDGFDDLNTKKWVPQGISSSADAYDKGDWNGKEAWIVSWHNEDDTSVRVTFVDKETNKYRHVLLVYPTAKDDFGPVQIHAGGIAWYGDKLYVVDTDIGLRMFDLSTIWEVDDGSKIGKDGTKYTAASYKYVIPQISYYKLTPQRDFKFSYVALDRTSTPYSLIVGEYRTASSGKKTRLVKWNLDSENRKLKSKTASFGYCIGQPRMQGAVSVGEKVYISVSNEKNPGDLYTWTAGSKPKRESSFFPPSPEDLAYNKHGNELYGLTEGIGKRYILTYGL